jgi:hypothetical protein
MLKYGLPIVECSTSSSICPKVSRNERDSESLVSYIAKNYDSLPYRVVFLHAHRVSWHQLAGFEERLWAVIRSEKEFIHLGFIRVMTKRWRNTGWCEEVWKATFSAPCPTEVNTYQGMQFAASRRSIQHTKKKEWDRLRNVSLKSTTPLRNGFFTEWVVHILMGQPAKLWSGECKGTGFGWTCGRRSNYTQE